MGMNSNILAFINTPIAATELSYLLRGLPYDYIVDIVEDAIVIKAGK